ncbi:hypothetical protein DPMN_106003 [Dreissena polymorpha]|uniref:Uncharacterized protein n=1 Tax=Dreissena polymorpha TaxID=45954 RepID=A0A9D4QIB3_DREPO|nr:hypothetical protein DPMN_106003 [Dreissena polymorpha]
MRAELKEFTKKCVQCEDRKTPPQQEKLKQHSDGLRPPWNKVASDLFQIQNRKFVIKARQRRLKLLVRLQQL